jgi:hypothetical protein
MQSGAGRSARNARRRRQALVTALLLAGALGLLHIALASAA